jgi:hypothetical protein
MADISLVDAQAALDAAIAAHARVLRGEYSIGSRSARPPSLKDLTENIEYWRRIVARLESGGSGGIRVRGVTPI